jgi:hypothetical protein
MNNSSNNNSLASERRFVTVIETRMPAMRFYLAIVIAAIFTIASQAATGEKSQPSGGESLGGRLLDDLSPDAALPKAPRQPAQDAPAMKAIENSLKASTPLHGFGAGANPAAQSLARVQTNMQHVQSMLTQLDAAANADAAKLASPVQREILSDLDKLIADLSKQCQCCNGQCNQPPKPGQKPGKPGASAGSGRTAARDSTDRLDRSSAKPVDKGEVNEMVKALWGHLPERSREQMLQSFSDEFLPKYELEIEQYYRRLSEEQGESSSK